MKPCPFPFPAEKMPSGAATSSSSAQEILKYLERLPNSEQVADLVACALLPEPSERQTILEAVDLEVRLKHLIHFLMAEIRRPQKNKPA